MVDKLVTEHKRTWNSDQPPRDLTDAFMAEMEKVMNERLMVAFEPHEALKATTGEKTPTTQNNNQPPTVIN